MGHSKGVATEDINHVCIKFSKRYEDLTKRLHEGIFKTFFYSCLRRDGFPKTMKCLVFKLCLQLCLQLHQNISELAVNSFYKRLLVIT